MNDTTNRTATAAFETWKGRVDRWCWELGGCSLHDLPDVPLYDWFEDNLKPRTAARWAVRGME